MEDSHETENPQEALAEIWKWLSSAGNHFTGAWSLNADEEKREHRASLMMKGLPTPLKEGVRGVIRKVALDVGWKAKHIRFLKDRVEFVLKPYPLETRLLEEARSSEFRQAAHRKREETLRSPEGSRSPAP